MPLRERHGREAPRFRRDRGGAAGSDGKFTPAGVDAASKHVCRAIRVRHGEHARRLLVGTGEAQRGRHEEARGARLARARRAAHQSHGATEAHATQSICRSFGVNCASAAAPAMALRMPR